MAGLKVCQSLLGSHLLPVPSLYLSGLTNRSNIIKRALPFEDMLTSSLSILRELQEPFVLFVGYLGNAQQAQYIAQCIEDYKALIHAVVIDPVSGDHGKQYVPDEVLKAWPSLLKLADVVLPNFTELQLLLGEEIDFSAPVDQLITIFSSQYPQTVLLGTSIPQQDPNQIGLVLAKDQQIKRFSHAKIKGNISGSGDAFSSTFIYFHYIERKSLTDSMQLAAHACMELIAHSLNSGYQDLQIGYFQERTNSSI